MSEEPPPKKVNYCPYCGEELPEDLQEYCPGCGVKLSDGTKKEVATRGEIPAAQGQTAPNATETNPAYFFTKPLPPTAFQAPAPELRGIRCIHCKGTGFCKFCAGAGSINNKECVQCGGTGRCMICQGRGVL